MRVTITKLHETYFCVFICLFFVAAMFRSTQNSWLYIYHVPSFKTGYFLRVYSFYYNLVFSVVVLFTCNSTDSINV